MSLARIQEDFLDAVLGDGPADAGMAIYRGNALAVHRDALAASHPVVRRLVGDAFFAEAAARFARACPSTSGDLHAYGGPAFATFLAGYAPGSELPFLPDVARPEWAVHECEHAADGKPLDHAALGALPGEALPGLRLRLHPAVRLVESAHPILAIWEANQEGRDGTVERDAGPDRVLVRREGFTVVPVLADDDAWALLTAFARGLTLADACAVVDCDDALAPALARIAAWGVLGGHEGGEGA